MNYTTWAQTAVRDFPQLLLFDFLPLCMKVSLTKHMFLVTLGLESLLTHSSSGTVAEDLRPAQFLFSYRLYFSWMLVCLFYPYNFYVSDFCLKQKWIQCISLPKVSFVTFFPQFEKVFIFLILLSQKYFLAQYSSPNHLSFMLGKLKFSLHMTSLIF